MPSGLWDPFVVPPTPFFPHAHPFSSYNLTPPPSLPPSIPTVGPCTPGLRKLGPWKTSERREKRDAWRNKGKGEGRGVWSTGSFSIPMEQKVNDGSIVL